MLEIKTILQITDECLFFLSKYDEWLLINEKNNINGGLRYLLFSCYNGKKKTYYLLFLTFFLKKIMGWNYISAPAQSPPSSNHISKHVHFFYY